MEGLLIRQAISPDIPELIALDHGYSTDHVWQMEYRQGSDELTLAFREVRLPRPMRVGYPRDPSRLADEWTRRGAVLVAELAEAKRGYAVIAESTAPDVAWLTDLVVGLRDRRQGVATRLIGAAHGWAKQRSKSRVFLEMQSKNYPAIRLARKLGFVFSGYSEQYYPDEDIALFFSLDVV
jgi:ribosomal protein S18 acetylase RimI-like enzyme